MCILSFVFFSFGQSFGKKISGQLIIISPNTLNILENYDQCTGFLSDFSCFMLVVNCYLFIVLRFQMQCLNKCFFFL